MTGGSDWQAAIPVCALHEGRKSNSGRAQGGRRNFALVVTSLQTLLFH